MTTTNLARLGTLALAILAAGTLTGCANLYNPKDLKQPVNVTCIDVPAGLESHYFRGLWDAPRLLKLRPGAYVAEYEDVEGTFYRGPYLALENRALNVDADVAVGGKWSEDGGIWVPRDASRSPEIYTIIMKKDVATSTPDGLTCGSSMVIRDATGAHRTKVVAAPHIESASRSASDVGLEFGTSGIFTDGKVPAAGVVGGAVGGAIVSALIEMDVGKRAVVKDLADDRLRTTLRELAKNAQPLPSQPMAISK